MRKLFILFYALSSSIIQNIRAQCLVSGPMSGSITANDVSIGTIAWNNTGNITVSDGLKASSTALIIGDKTNYLVVKGFGFNITSPVSICGISVNIEKSASGLLQIVKDHSVRLVKGGNITGSDKAQSISWSGTDVISTYGSNADLWGETWTASDINSPDFGVAISADLTSLSALPTANLDNITITVYYMSALPIELTNFYAKDVNEEQIKLLWETKSEVNNDYFSIQRSLDALNWTEIGKVKAVGNSSISQYYQFIDERVSDEMVYYRIKQIYFDGSFQYSEVLLIEHFNSSNEVKLVSSNPCTNELILKADYAYENSFFEMFIIEAETGKIVSEHQLLLSGNNIINTKYLDAGLYFISVTDGYSIDKKIKFLKSN